MDEVITLVCNFLNRENIGYVIVGGLTAILYGIPRTTMDVDLIISLKEENIPKLVKYMRENDFFANKEDLKSALSEKTHCTIQDKKSLLRLDVKGVYSKGDKRSLENSVSFNYQGITCYISRPEDLIANKLLYDSEQDIRDAEGVYARQLPKLDQTYLTEAAEALGVREELAELKERVEKIIEEEKL